MEEKRLKLNHNEPLLNFPGEKKI